MNSTSVRYTCQLTHPGVPAFSHRSGLNTHRLKDTSLLLAPARHANKTAIIRPPIDKRVSRRTVWASVTPDKGGIGSFQDAPEYIKDNISMEFTWI
jgi:hypothetical protein